RASDRDAQPGPDDEGMMSNRETALREADEKCARLRVHSLTADVALLVWEDRAGHASGRRLCATIGGQPVEPPYAHVRVRVRSPHRALEERNITVLRADAAAMRHERVCIMQTDGSLIAVTDAVADPGAPAGRPVAFAPIDLIDGVDAKGRLRIARLMFAIVPDIFRINDSPAFAAACQRLAAALAPAPPALLPCATLFGSYGLFAGMADAALGPRLNAVVISSVGLARAPFAPAFSGDASDGEASRLWLVIREIDARDATAIVVVFSDCGMICRRITASDRRVPSAIEWLRGSGSLKAGAGGRRYILDCLARLGRQHAQAAALLRELQAMMPPACVSSMPLSVAAGADLIVASSAGVFVKGWLADPQGLVEAICIEQPRSKRRIDIRSVIRFPRRNVPKQGAADGDATEPSRVVDTLDGFAFFSANDADGDEPWRISLSLCLCSGTALAFAEGPSVMQPHAARDAVLAAVPPLYLSRKTIADWIEPTVVALHEKDQKAATSAGSCAVIDIGCVPNSPDAAVISPVPDDPLLMRYRAGLIAADPEMRSVDVLYILERAQDQREIEGFLRGIHAAYGLAARLVVLPHPGTAAAAFNAGARVSRASLLVWLGAAVSPERPSWLAQLIGHLRRDANIGIVGARLLRQDQALWNDGLAIGGDGDFWDIQPVRAGFPRGFAPPQRVRHVTAVSPGCIAVRRSVLESYDGFSERYLSSDYSVADLCLGAASAGFKTCLTSEPTLFRLDPPGNERRASEALDPRVEIDRRLLERRWRSRPKLAARRHDACSESNRPAGAAFADASAA
ncbi:MAG: hypothetical protein ACXWVS_10315, partial [Hyphomicrobium sp.]